jgi:hypothetical protein
MAKPFPTTSPTPAWSVQLQLHDGTPSRWISGREAERILQGGEAVRVRRKAHQTFDVIRLRKPPEYGRAYPLRATMPRPDESVFPEEEFPEE